MLIGDRLKILREEKRITQKQLGQVIMISDRIIGYYEVNDRFPKDEETLTRIADYFNVSVDWLLGRTEIRSFKGDGSNILHVDIEGLSAEDIKKIEEYAFMLKNKSK